MQFKILKNIPFLVLFILPFVVTSLIALYQIVYWSGAKTTRVPLQSIARSEARAFKPSDERRAEIIEIEVVFTDDGGQQHAFKQLSPFTEYFLSYGDDLHIKYFNSDEFEATIYNFSVKFYYLYSVLAYLLVSALFVGFAKRRTIRRALRRPRSKTSRRIP